MNVPPSRSGDAAGHPAEPPAGHPAGSAAGHPAGPAAGVAAEADHPGEPADRPLVHRVGRAGLLVELGSSAATEALHAEVLRRRGEGTLPAVREIVPGARTVLLDGFGGGAEAVGRLAAELPHWRVPPLTGGAEHVVEIPVSYDGPDVADVAALWGVSADEVARLHAATEFRVAFCGFAPGFGYLTGLDEKYHVPRRANPRTKVPAGAVGLAGGYTGVYPRSSPGGWQLIGTAHDTVLWDTARDPAALLAPGTRVRFRPVDGAERPVDGAERPVDGAELERSYERDQRDQRGRQDGRAAGGRPRAGAATGAGSGAAAGAVSGAEEAER